jgi:hypothetical protein
VHAIGERPAATVLGLVEEAERFIGRAPTVVALELLGGKAQALALAGRHTEAEKSLVQLRGRFSAAPSNGYSGSLLAWGEERLHNTESFTYSRLGDDRNAEEAQRAASALYKDDPSNLRWPAGVEMNRAYCRVRNGDVTDGLAHAREIVTGLPAAHQTRGLFIHGRDVLNAVPEAERDRPVVSEYREWLNSAFSTA